MREGPVKVVNDLGLHARAAAQLLRVASGFRSSIELRNPTYDRSANARSILNVLTLSGSKGSVLSLNVTGEDEDPAFEAIQDLFSRGFGEL